MTKKRIIQTITVVAGSIFVVLAGCSMYLKTSSGKVLQLAPNPAGDVIAEVVDDDSFASAMDAGSLDVTLKTRLNPIRHYVFGGPNYGAHLQVTWLSTNVLLIRCVQCEKLKWGDTLEPKWHQVTICYDRSDVPPSQPTGPCAKYSYQIEKDYLEPINSN